VEGLEEVSCHEVVRYSLSRLGDRREDHICAMDCTYLDFVKFVLWDADYKNTL